MYVCVWLFSCGLSMFLLNFVGLNEFYCLFSFSCSFFSLHSPLSLSLSIYPLFAHLTRSYHFYCCSQFEYLIYYVILRFALCSSSPFGNRLSTLWIYEKRLRASTTLPHFNKKTALFSMFIRSDDIQIAYTSRFVADKNEAPQ